MIVFFFFKIFAKAQEPEFIEDEWNAFGSESGIAIGNLEVQVCAGSIAGVADLREAPRLIV